MARLIEISEFETLGDVVVIEASLSDDTAAAAAKYVAGHIPGALFADRDIWARDPEAGEGRNPLPRPEQLAADLSALGLSLTSRIVIYDRFKNVYATRAAWVLANAGFVSVEVLNGGLALWEREGKPLEAGKNSAKASKLDLEWDLLPSVQAAEVQAFPAEGILIDARNADRFAGIPDPKDPRSGHVPGAINLPWESLYDADGRFREPDALRQVFADLGVTGERPIAAYCGSGISATYIITALERAGLPSAALYPGSWSEWGANDALPIAVSKPV